MAASSRGRAEASKQWREREASPERTRVWADTKPRALMERKAAVVYYLSRDGHLEHPHFMEVAFSPTSDGLYLRDVISRLNALRGRGMASMYSWSSKRSYKNGFVWHDLAEDDFIYPVHGNEYVLKGTQFLLLLGGGGSSSHCSQEAVASSSSYDRPLEISMSARDDADLAPVQRKKAGWSSLDLVEYKVYKSDPTADAAAGATDASTQTDERRHRRRAAIREEEEMSKSPQTTSELGRDEISPPPPPPPSSSPETLATLIKANGTILTVQGQNPTAGGCSSGRVRASAVLMHLISCGSISVKGTGVPLAAQYRVRPPRAAAAVDGLGEMPSFRAKVVEEKEYFSGSLVETKRTAAATGGEFPALRRSSSYNAHRDSKIELPKEIDGVRARCMPGKPKMMKEEYLPISRSIDGSEIFGG